MLSIEGEANNEIYEFSGDFYGLVKPNLPAMVPVEDKFSCFFFESPKVVYDGCVKVGLDSCSGDVFGVFTLCLFSQFDPIFGPIMFIKLCFFNSI